jgi:hypothetical protein
VNERQHDTLNALQRASHELLDAQERLEAAEEKYAAANKAHSLAVAADPESWNATQIRRPTHG